MAVELSERNGPPVVEQGPDIVEDPGAWADAYGAAPHVIIVGAGFAGLAAAKALKDAPLRVSIIDKENHHLFQPLLYQVATAALSGVEVSAPIRSVLSDQRNARVLLGEVCCVDKENKTLRMEARGGRTYELRWDALIVAAGAVTSWFGNDDWAAAAPGLKSLADAHRIRDRMLLAYERAELSADLAERRRLLTFVVVGGGPTGVELAGALSEIARQTMKRDFRTFNPAGARVLLVEAGPRLLNGYDERLSARAKRDLEALGVEVVLNRMVTAVDEGGLSFGDDRLEAATVLWAAGVQAAPLASELNAGTLRDGRVLVEPNLRLPGSDMIWLAGDIAAVAREPGTALDSAAAAVPAVAPAAQQMGEHAAAELLRALSGEPEQPFRYRDRGAMATIGRSRAIVQMGKFKATGLFAWLIWVFVHLMALVGFRNRVSVFIDWVVAYFSFRRGARLILSRDEPLQLESVEELPSIATS